MRWQRRGDTTAYVRQLLIVDKHGTMEILLSYQPSCVWARMQKNYAITFGADYGFKDSAESMILSVPPAESMILSVLPTESMILVAWSSLPLSLLLLSPSTLPSLLLLSLQ